jgi:hypothetical protein
LPTESPNVFRCSTPGLPQISTAEIHPLDGSDSEWNAAVEELDGSTFCHLAAWRRILSDVMGHETSYWTARDGGGRITGLLPMARVRSRLFGDYLLSLPFLSYGGPLGPEAARRTLAHGAAAGGAELGEHLVEAREEQGPGDAEGGRGLGGGALGLGGGGWSGRGGSRIGGLGGRLTGCVAAEGDDAWAEPCVRGEHAVVAVAVDARWGQGIH